MDLTNNITMKTLKTSLFILLTTTLLFSCKKDEIRGSGTVVSQERALSGFENVMIQGAVRTNVSYGSDFHVTVRTDATAISRVETRVADNTLIVDLDERYNYQHITFTVDVVMPVIHELTHEGVGNSSLSGFNALDDLRVVHNGVGDLHLSGSATELEIEHDGVGKVKAFEFATERCSVGQSGVGNIEVRVSDVLEGHLHGVGNIHYRGQPAVSIHDSGVGNVIHVD
ncbi:MAG: DUF2807 domain-containing protein [Flavobacteriales bacterium]|nr:DUF2807 domain-containing protein [Flavobacteriales bacterium]